MNATGTKLNTRVVDDTRQIIDRAKVPDGDLAIRRFPAVNPPVPKVLPLDGHFGHGGFRTRGEDVVFEPPQPMTAGDDSERGLLLRHLETTQAVERADRLCLEQNIVGRIV